MNMCIEFHEGLHHKKFTIVAYEENILKLFSSETTLSFYNKMSILLDVCFVCGLKI